MGDIPDDRREHRLRNRLDYAGDSEALLHAERPVNDRPYNVLFLCTANSARSILAESLLNYWGGGKFRGFSAGSYPKGQVHPLVVELLGDMNLPTDGLYSKSWDVFATAGAPRSILSSRSATTPRARPARSGRASR
jgi:hypothetical protein